MGNRRVCTKELAKLTGLSAYQINLGIKKGTIPYIRIGRRLLFDPEMVLKALDLEAEQNQAEARKKYELAQEQKEVIHYGKLVDLLK
jgi:2,4-dienoyl-CoA reductase-like NADH-dependent reductase (Old Yellow Enzyme family)